jgi:hypothetical protein
LNVVGRSANFDGRSQIEEDTICQCSKVKSDCVSFSRKSKPKLEEISILDVNTTSLVCQILKREPNSGIKRFVKAPKPDTENRIPTSCRKWKKLSYRDKSCIKFPHKLEGIGQEKWWTNKP